MTGCCVPLCTGSTEKGQRLFRFPRDSARREKWQSQVKRERWKATDNSKICELHFDQDQYEANRQDGRRLLKPSAVPTLFDLKTPPGQGKAPHQQTPQILPASAADADRSSSGDSDLSGEELQENSSDRVAEWTDISSLSSSELVRSLQDLRKKHAALQERFFDTTRKLKKQVRRTKQLEEVISTLTSSLKFLNEDQKAALLKKNKKNCVWSAESIEKALQLKYACGVTGYDLLLEQGIPLPSKRTLARRLEHPPSQPGVHTETFDITKAKVATLSDVERDCVLFLHEMGIRSGMELGRGSDTLLRTTLPETDHSANRALVLTGEPEEPRTPNPDATPPADGPTSRSQTPLQEISIDVSSYVAASYTSESSPDERPPAAASISEHGYASTDARKAPRKKKLDPHSAAAANAQKRLKLGQERERQLKAKVHALSVIINDLKRKQPDS